MLRMSIIVRLERSKTVVARRSEMVRFVFMAPSSCQSVVYVVFNKHSLATIVLCGHEFHAIVSNRQEVRVTGHKRGIYILQANLYCYLACTVPFTVAPIHGWNVTFKRKKVELITRGIMLYERCCICEVFGSNLRL